MKQFLAKGNHKSGHIDHVYEIQVLSYFDEDEQVYYAICPALDIVGGGKTEEEAITSFNISLDEFVKYTCNKRTIARELMRLGWEVHLKGRNHFKAKSPSVEELKNNPEWAEVWAKAPHVANRTVQLAA